MALVGELPEQFGRYRLLKRLGQGGMGSVYLAEDSQLGRKVALKVATLGSMNDPQMIARFDREARAAAVLDHPNLCPIYDSGKIDGAQYLTMAFIEGESLADWLKVRERIPQREAVEIVSKIAKALHHAHAVGVVHRDLKPSNVMMKRVGVGREPVIVDFGLARRDDVNEAKLTQTGHFLGTPHYMAPEQIRGELDGMGPSLDIYALGVILFELLTSQPPFDGPTPLVVIAQILMHEAPRPSSVLRSLDPAIERVCIKAMAKDRKDRYTSMAEFAEALDAVIPSSPKAESVQSSPSKSSPIDQLISFGAEPVVAKNESIAVVDDGEIDEEVQLYEPAPSFPWLKVFAIAVPSVLLVVFLFIKLNRGNAVTGGTSPKVWTSPSTGMELLLIPAGEFDMGTPSEDQDAYPNEKPLHHVRITKPFFLGKFEVTRGQYQKFIDESSYGIPARRKIELRRRSPGFEQTDDHPVVNVSWNDALKFAEWLSKKDGRTYRLPTEAEWEYACRAGTKTKFSFGDDSNQISVYANIEGERDTYKNTAPVGRFRPNAWGLYDMHGNVWEWCADFYDPDYYKNSPTDDPQGPETPSLRVVRGGSWAYVSRVGRSADRDWRTPGLPYDDQGFRLVLVQAE